MRNEGYVVECAEDFITAETKIAGYNYDCILLDIMLPGGSGLDLLEQLRSMGRGENVIIISARDSVDDRVAGLELGADDYLAKPFHMSELVARVRSVLRRGRSGGELSIDIENVSLTPSSRRVVVDGREMSLLKKEFDILHYFMQRPEHLVDKAVLAEAVWGDYADESDNFQFIYAQIKNLRRKLKEANARIEIRSIYGFGYKLTNVE
jgi:DNA-binding response OmpR family regulator